MCVRARLSVRLKAGPGLILEDMFLGFLLFFFFAEPLFFWSGCLSSACSCLPQLASDQTPFSRYILFHAPRNATTTTTTTRNVHLTPLPHPYPVCFLSYHSTKYFLILFSPSGLCLLELQVKLEDIISSGTQKSAESAPHTPQPSTPPSLALPPNLPPHTDPPPWPGGWGRRRQRNTRVLGEKRPFVLPSAPAARVTFIF